MTSMTTWIRRELALFAVDTGGATAVMFGLLAIPLAVIAIGAIDIARQSVVRQQLQETLDASALIVARSTAKTDADMEKVGDAAFAAQVTDVTINGPTSSFVSAPGNSVNGSASGYIEPIILGIIGIKQLRADVTTEIKRAQGTPVELVLVLDTTESMKDVPGKMTPLSDLKTAATKLVNDLHKNADGANLKIGVVPFGKYVNVGVSRRYEPWIAVPVDYSTTSKRTCSNEKETICTGKEPYPCPPVDGRNPGTTCSRNTGCVTKDKIPIKEVCTDPKTTLHTFHGCVGSPPHPKNVNDSDPSRVYPGFIDATCNSEITPLTADKTKVTKAITALTATGNTYIPSGLAWGFNMLSKAQPLTDAQAYDPTGANLQPRKAVVLMTDGANTLIMQKLSAPLVGYNHEKAVTPATQADTYTSELCDNIKKEKIEVFTVAFMIDDPAAKTLLQACATDDDHYFDAADAAKLQVAFGAIAESLRNLYIAK